MNFIKIAWRDIVSIFKNRFIRVSVTAIIIVPLLYSLLYLYAFWDPYNKLADMPVAVVNLDKGSVKDGENVNYGDDIVKKLKDNNKIGWRFVSKDVAEKGVKNKDYYAMFVVPEDFSTKLLSAKNGKPEQPNILYTANEKRNFLAAQINGKVLVELKAEITKSITNEYTKVTFDNLYELKDGMQKAADGSKELKDGIGQVKDKLPEMKDGVGKLDDGSGKLKDGLGQLKDGAAQLFYGADALNQALGQAKDGSDKLNNGLNQLNGNVPALKDGVSKLTDGSLQLYNGIITNAVDPLTGKPLGLKNGVNQLASGLNDAKSKVGDLDNGAGQVLDGAKQLGDGLNKLNTAVNIGGNGQPSLIRALGMLNDGITNKDPQKGLGAGVTALNAAVNDGVKDANGNLVKPSLKDAITSVNSGVSGKLQPAVSGLYNAFTVDTVDAAGNVKPSLSTAVTQIANGAQGLNDLITAYNAETNPAQKTVLMNQIMVTANQLKNGTANLNTAVNVGVGSQPKLVDVVKGLNTAVNVGESGQPSLVTAIGTINNGIQNELSPGVTNLNAAVNIGVNGKPSLVNGISSVYAAVTDKTAGLSSGVTQLNDAVNNGVKDANGNIVKPSLIAGLTQLKGGTSQFAGGIASAASGANDLLLGVNKLSDGSMQIKDGLYALNGNVPTLADGIGQLYAGSTQLNDGLGQIKDGSSQLKNAVAKPEEVKDMAKKDSKADSTLFNGVGQLYDGSKELNNGLNTLNGKIPELQDGANKLYDGSKELNNKLTEGSDKLNKNLINDSNTMATYVSEPLRVDEKPMFAVKNYGTGFAPYFIPLSLWIGALMMFFVITEKVDDDIKASSASIVLGKYLSYGYIGIIQAVLASVVVIALGLRPDNVPLYFLFNIFMSFVFIAIIQCLVFLLGMAGRLLSIILLILQLTSCAGTFPLEVVPTLFKVLNPFMPFTYCVSALREVISGMDYAVFSKDIAVLAVYMVAFLTISVLFKGHADKVQERIKEKAVGVAS